MISKRIALSLLTLGCLASHNALAQCYAKADSCGTGYIAVPKPECEPNAHYACHPDPNYVPPAGAVTGMSLQSNPVATNGNVVLHLTGQNKCDYGFVARDGVGNTIFSVAAAYNPATTSRTINLANLGYFNPGNYQLALVSPPGKNACTQVPAPVALSLFSPPFAMSGNNVSVHSKDTAHFNTPFPFASQLTYGLFSGAAFQPCLVDVSITGPDSQSYPGTLLEFTKTHDFSVSKAGHYVIIFATSANATGSQKCSGGPVAKAFDVDEQKFLKVQNGLPMQIKAKP